MINDQEGFSAANLIASMHESAFSYSLLRPYPYRWFTWTTLIGGLAFTALFSVINLAAVGYETKYFAAQYCDARAET